MKCLFSTLSPLANFLLFRFWTTAPPSRFSLFPDCLLLPSMPLCFHLSQLFFFLSFSKLVFFKVWLMNLQHQNHLGPDQTKWIRTAEGKLGGGWGVCWLVKCSWGFLCTPEFTCEELTHWKRLWCWEGLGAGGEGDDRRWDGWMASPTRWTWTHDLHPELIFP